MADVTGSIGSEHVELNNAATEATLKLLLHSNLAANKQSIENIKNLAQKSGVNPEAILATEEAFAATTKQTDIFKASIYEAGRVVGALSPALKKITEGTGQASDLLEGLANASSGLPVVGGVISAVVSGFATLAKVQESYLLSFESISKTGASFNGSLGEMRLSASQAYLTLDQFSKVVKTNQDVFSSLGGDVQKGVDTFVRIQNTLLAPGSAVSKNLGYLGVSAEEAADLTASYIRSQGTLNKTNLQDATMVSAAVGQYAQELTVLSELTGKSREELQKKLDEENAEAQYQAFLAQMDDKTAAKFRQGMEMAMAQGGKPAMDAFKSIAMGLPPLTKAAQMYYSTQQAGIESLQQFNQNARNTGLSLEESSKMNRLALAHSIAAGSQDMDRMRTVLQVSGLAGTELANTLSDAQKLQNKYMKEGKMLSEAEIAADLERIATNTKREDGTAEAAQQTQRRMQELGQKILTGLMPTIEYFQSMLNENIGSITSFIQDHAVPAFIDLAQGTVKVVEYIKQNAEKLKLWGEVLGGVTLGMIGLKTVVSTMAGIQRTGAALGIPGLEGLGASINRPMYVYVVNMGKLAGAEGAAGAGAGKEGKGGRFGRAGAYALGGVAAGLAGSGAEAIGSNKLGAVADIGSSALSGAALGALIPGLGEVGIGEALGAIAGVGYGLYQNWGTFFADSKRDLKAQQESKEKADKDSKNREDTSPTFTGDDPVEKLVKAVELLNTHMLNLEKYTLQTSNNTRDVVSAVKNLDGNVFHRP